MNVSRDLAVPEEFPISFQQCENGYYKSVYRTRMPEGGCVKGVRWMSGTELEMGFKQENSSVSGIGPSAMRANGRTNKWIPWDSKKAAKNNYGFFGSKCTQ